MFRTKPDTPLNAWTTQFRRLLISGIDSVSSVVARSHLALFGDRGTVVALLFHAMLQNEAQRRAGWMEVQQAVTVDTFRTVIEYFAGRGYRFVSPGDIADGKLDAGKYALVTFDDGYYNNHLALPVIRELKVPTVFHISTAQVMDQKCFWWDVFWHRSSEAGMPPDEAERQIRRLKTLDIDQPLRRQFGGNALEPWSDEDRPFTAAELADFAHEPYVVLGNHTRDHAILTNYEPDEVRQQLGRRPVCLAYPNGNYSPNVLRISREAGFKLALTVEPRKTRWPLDPVGDPALSLGRFMLREPDQIERQYRVFRSDLVPANLLRGWRNQQAGPRP